MAMVTTITIECPHCKKSFEVLLSNNASMIILSCPACSVPLIYYKTRCFMLNRNQIDRIRKSRRDTTVLKILHRISQEQPRAGFAEYVSGGRPLVHCCPDLYATIASFSQSENFITRDDIINLRIELETCADSGQFIERM